MEIIAGHLGQIIPQKNCIDLYVAKKENLVTGKYRYIFLEVSQLLIMSIYPT